MKSVAVNLNVSNCLSPPVVLKHFSRSEEQACRLVREKSVTNEPAVVKVGGGNYRRADCCVGDGRVPGRLDESV
jgi:hypothetical protein